METESPLPSALPTLDTLERRVLGVLVEKAKTTPDAYPLSLNALTVGCNQKSNRDPIMNVNDDQVSAVLEPLQQRGLVTKITGGRVDRWRHNLYEQWQVDKAELAILAELMLRGPQTEGELRGHATRMEPIPDLETLRQKLKPMTERKLILFLGLEGRRGTQIASCFYSPEEMSQLQSTVRVEASLPASSPGAQALGVDADFAGELRRLKEHVEQLESAVAEMRDEMQRLRASLGG
jgi:uncharacterized protein